DTIAWGVNDIGSIVGQSGVNAFIFHLEDPSLTNLNDLTFTGDLEFDQLKTLLDINDEGYFVGIAEVDGVEHGIVGRVVPEPSALLLGAVGGATFLACRQWHRRRQR